MSDTIRLNVYPENEAERNAIGHVTIDAQQARQIVEMGTPQDQQSRYLNACIESRGKEIERLKIESSKHAADAEQMRRERDAARAELDAIKARKVVLLPGRHRTDGILPMINARGEAWNFCLDACADAIRAAGVEVVE
jgi:hypothetical protein